jgi:hypothetical protein
MNNYIRGLTGSICLLYMYINRGNILIILKIEVAKVEILSPFPFKYKPAARATLEII